VQSDDVKSILDRARLATDLVKHISTLASGSIVVLATFLTRVVQAQDHDHVKLDKSTLIGTVILLSVCIVSCSVYLFFFGIRKTWTDQHAEALQKPSKPELVLSAAIFLTFCGGIVFLGIYAVKSFGVSQ